MTIFSRLHSRLVAYTQNQESIAPLFLKTISFGQQTQCRHLPPSSPSTLPFQHCIKFPAQPGFLVWQTVTFQGWRQRPSPGFACGTPTGGSWKLIASENVPSWCPRGWYAKLQVSGFKTLWTNGPQWGYGPFCSFPEKAKLVFLLWPIIQCCLLDTVPVTARPISQYRAKSWKQLQDPIHHRAACQSFRWWALEVTESISCWSSTFYASCTENTQKNPGSSSAISLREISGDESRPLNAISGWSRDNQLGGLQV